jgi:TonB-dependent starch-binding outer membrane protein SusC
MSSGRQWLAARVLGGGAVGAAARLALGARLGAQDFAVPRAAYVVRLDAPPDLERAPDVLRQPVTLRLKKVTVAQALDELIARTRISLSYSRALIPADRIVSVDVDGGSVLHALGQMLGGTGVEVWVSSGGRIALVPADAPAASAVTDAARPVTMAAVLTGSVVDSVSSRPLANAQVAVVGTQLGALTNDAGRFTITGVPAGTHTVRTILIGYAPQTRTVTVVDGQSAAVDFQLRAQALQLDAVVAIGYGTARRRDLTGSLSSVTGEDLTARAAPTTSVATALVGRAPGVQVVSNSGTPGEAASIRIRGTNSITGGSDPLYVIDGIPIAQSNGTNLTAAGTQTTAASLSGGTPLSTIDPNNIESIQVLKDASATAIYGARGANGVVLITTKRGQRGANEFSLETSYGVQKPTKFIPVLNAQEFRTLVNEGLANAGLAARYTADDVAQASTYDYPRMLLNDLAWQPQQNHTVTISGGDQQSRYLLSGSFLDQTGIVLNSGYQRYGARVNLDRTVSGKFRVGASLSGTRSAQQLNGASNTGNDAGSTGITIAMQFDPATMPFDPATGVWNKSVVLNSNIWNPYTEAVNRDGSDRTTTVLSSVFGEYDLPAALTLREQLSGNLNFLRGTSYSPSFIASGNNLGTARQNSGERRELTSSTTLQYRRELGPGSLDALVGADVQTSRYEILTAEARGFPVEQLKFYNLGAGSTLISPTSTNVDWTLLSQLGRINYNLLDRYIFTVTGRRDGSSRFGANDKWAFFPSAAFAWRAIDEPFLKHQTLLSDLKFRLSYGRTGNQAINPYQSLEQLTTIFVARGTGQDVVTLAPDVAAGNPNLKWETQDQFNVGTDVGLLDNRVSLTVDAYQSTTSNLLLSTNQSWVLGVNTQLQNVGAVRNRGLELGLNTVNYQGGRLRWETQVSVAVNRNEVTELYGGLQNLGAGSSTQVGQPLNTIVGYQVLGLWQQGDACTLTNTRQCAPGEYRFLDANGDKVINDDDRVNLGSPQADYYGGFGNKVSYGPLSVDAFFNFSVGNEINSFPFERFLGLVGGASNERRDRALNRWTPTNTNTTVPRANITRSVNPTYSTYVEDGSFLRLQTLSFSYRLPKRLFPRGAESARLTVTGQNLWTATKYSGYDPENNINGTDSGGYPKARTWNVGLNATF